MQTVLEMAGIAIPVIAALFAVMQRLTRVETKVDIMMSHFNMSSSKGD